MESITPPATNVVDPALPLGDENANNRTVVFPENDPTDEKHLRSEGNGLRRQITQEDKELAAAGYEYLENQKAKKSEKAAKLDQNVDLTEHGLALAELGAALKTAIDFKDPGKSPGLTPEDAAARLASDGRNVLTPPKKRTALRMVQFITIRR